VIDVTGLVPGPVDTPQGPLHQLLEQGRCHELADEEALRAAPRTPQAIVPTPPSATSPLEHGAALKDRHRL
ncbi:hypothetical protein, partial [Streptomyces sp. NTH33]|uniref:hypothetical protein n=1 Tax=Streptomyces sp. NTH33 TaxID=1735453 RepID=UPI001C645644